MTHTADYDAPCAADAPKPFVDFGGHLYGAHEIARNLGKTCPHCGVTFEFWGDAPKGRLPRAYPPESDDGLCIHVDGVCTRVTPPAVTHHAGSPDNEPTPT